MTEDKPKCDTCKWWRVEAKRLLPWPHALGWCMNPLNYSVGTEGELMAWKRTSDTSCEHHEPPKDKP